jgi:hypothetical protein
VVGAVGQLQHLDHLLDALAAQLLLNGVQVAGALRPKVQLTERPRVRASGLRTGRQGTRNTEDAVNRSAPTDQLLGLLLTAVCQHAAHTRTP